MKTQNKTYKNQLFTLFSLFNSIFNTIRSLKKSLLTYSNHPIIACTVVLLSYGCAQGLRSTSRLTSQVFTNYAENALEGNVEQNIEVEMQRQEEERERQELERRVQEVEMQRQEEERERQELERRVQEVERERQERERKLQELERERQEGERKLQELETLDKINHSIQNLSNQIAMICSKVNEKNDITSENKKKLLNHLYEMHLGLSSTSEKTLKSAEAIKGFVDGFNPLTKTEIDSIIEEYIPSNEQILQNFEDELQKMS